MALFLVGNKTVKGTPCYIIQENGGRTTAMPVVVVKSEMKAGRMTLANAYLTENGRLMRRSEAETKKQAIQQVGLQRTPEIQAMNANQKAKYYWDVLSRKKSLVDMSIFTIDELDAILCGGWDLEISDRGSSTVDMALQRNIFAYSGSMSRVLEEVIGRKYLTADECKQYLVGCDKNGRICNNISFADWIVKHAK